jgi:thiamine biosynthesis lipoprotein
MNKLINNPYVISKVTLRVIILIASSLMLLSCSNSQPQKLEINKQLNVFGTVVSISFYGSSEMQSTKATQSISNDLKVLHQAWSPWDNYAMARTNKLLNTTKWFSFNPIINKLLVSGFEYSRMSKGLFNPVIGQFTKLWGFNTKELSHNIPPSDQKIKSVLIHALSINDVSIKGVRLKSSNPNIVFDFDQMTHGVAMDLIIANLKTFNIQNAKINIGGDIKVIGKNTKSTWTVKIPHSRNKKALASIELQANESIFTTSDNSRFFLHEGVRYHNILDPRTGYPALNTRSVTVIHSNAALADAAATALFIAGPSMWHEIAQSMGIRYVILQDAKGTIHINPAMQKRVIFVEAPINLKISKQLQAPE